MGTAGLFGAAEGPGTPGAPGAPGIEGIAGALGSFAPHSLHDSFEKSFSAPHFGHTFPIEADAGLKHISFPPFSYVFEELSREHSPIVASLPRPRGLEDPGRFSPSFPS